MDRSQQTYSSLDELRQIQFEARASTSLDDLRQYFERVQNLRRAHIDDFDMQVAIAEVQEEIIGRARFLREQPAAEGAAVYLEEHPPAQLVRRSANGDLADPAASPEIEQVDTKTWQRATYLALFFTGVLVIAFIALVQAARKTNGTPAEIASQQAQPPAPAKNAPAQNTANVSNLPVPVSPKPAFRLYTDLIPGTVSLDNGDPVDLKDGQLILEDLKPGQHSVKVAGRSGSAVFNFDVDEKAAPRAAGVPSASNAMAVLVSQADGKGRLVTNAENSQVLLDGKPAGQAGTDGVDLDNLGTADHDLEVTQNKDHQRFVLTYTAAPTLTAYVKSDPNAGTVIINAALDGADVYINDNLYKRKTEHGQLRIPLKVGQYSIRVHKAGYLDPAPEQVDVKKAEESAVQFHLQPVPQVASLEIKGAAPGTMLYVDKDFAAAAGADGYVSVPNIKPGDHSIELRHDESLPKRFERTFHTGEAVVLSGPDVILEKVVAEKNPAPPPVAAPASAPAENVAAETFVDTEGSHIRKGGGFVPYLVPKTAGHYSFSAQGHIGGVFKHGKLQWYAGYEDAGNYVLFTLDGKHAIIREVRDGRSTEISRVPFNMDSNDWVEADVAVKPDVISARIRTTFGSWSTIGSVSSPGRDFTQGKAGFYIPSNDEVSVSNFKFASH